MRIVFLTLIVLLTQAIPSFAKCKPADICEMMKTIDHFSIQRTLDSVCVIFFISLHAPQGHNSFL